MSSNYLKSVFKAVHLIQVKLVTILDGTDDRDSNQFQKVLRELLFKLSFQELNETETEDVKFSRAFREIAVYLGSGYEDRSENAIYSTQKHRTNKLNILSAERPDSVNLPNIDREIQEITSN